jgi:hypothetical protein
MKKFISLFIAGLAALAAVSCAQEELVMFDASKATAPVLQSFVLTDDALTVDFTPGSFGQEFNKNMPVNHSIILKTVNGTAVGSAVPSSIKDGKLVVTVTNLTKALMALGYEEGQKVALEMAIRASMQETARDNGVNGFVESVGTISIPDYEVFLPTGDPYARYTEKSEWGLVGSFNGWGSDPDVEMWTNGTLHVAKGVKLSAKDEVKFRKDASWDVNFGYADGVSSYTLGEEFSVTQGGANIVIAEDGRYDLILDPAAGTAKIIDSVAEAEDPYAAYKDVSPWSVIGSFNSWGGDVEMVTNGTLHLCKNITLAEGDEFKFRKDAGWDVNFGYAEGITYYVLGEEFSVGQDGANIIIEESGAYDLFLDPENSTAKIIKTQAVVIDPYASYKEVSPWSVIGSFNSWGGDVEMVTNGTLHVAKAIALNADTEWKFRKDAGWDVNFGYAEGVSSYTLGEEFAVAQDGANIIIAEDGVYDFILDPENATAKIIASIAVEQPEPPAPVDKPKMWSLIGHLNGTEWDTDYDLQNVSGDKWVIKQVTVKEDDEFKIRADHDWGKSYGGPEANDQSTIKADDPYGVYKPVVGTEFAAGGTNIRIGKEGVYNVTLNYGDEPTILIEEYKEFPDALYMVGQDFGGWDWNSDGVVKLVPVVHNPAWGADAEGQFWTIRYFLADSGFKFNSARAWDGGQFGKLETNEGFTNDGDENLHVPADGLYMVHIDMKRNILHVEPARVYGIGGCFGGWDAGMESALFQNNGKTMSVTAADEGEFRMYAASEIATSDWWTREFIFFDGVIDYRGDDEGQGDQARVTVKKGQVVTLDFNAGTATVTGEGETPDKPQAWSLVGTLEDSGWGKDYDLENTSGDLWVIKNVAVREADEFKIRADHAWTKSVGGPEENDQSTYEEGNVYGVYKPELGKAFEAGDKNIRIGVAGNYTITFDYKANTILIEEYKEFPAALYMVGTDFGGWDWGSDGVVTLTPVLHNPDWGAEAPGQFYTIRALKAGNGFKLNSARAWDGGQFGSLETNEGFTNDGDGNVQVAEDGVYLIHVDLKKGILHVEPAKVYGIGDAFGGWDEAMESALFAAADGKLSATVKADGNLRMYAASGISTSGWWTREFNAVDGKIAFRLMDELAAVPVTAGQTVTLDFNAGTAVVE